jgi:DNA-directed RNA polymerase subunit H (RpoH/RPB5)
LVKRESELVPPHRIMSAKEIEELLGTRSIGINNLPKILFGDPQVKKLGATPGDVIEIVRDDDGVRYKYYRQVVEG